MRKEYMENEFYEQIKEILENARNNAYRAVNFVMVQAYWKIGKSIVEKQNGLSKSNGNKTFV